MRYYVLMYELVDDYISKRTPLRDEHLRLANEARARGELLLAGAFADPSDRALLVFRATDRTVPDAFAQNDPYVINGLVKRWEVRSWTVVIDNINSPAGMPGRL